MRREVERSLTAGHPKGPHVSGDPGLVLLGDHGGQLARLVQAIAGLEMEDLPRHALIGGIAVMARLQQRHRATSDIDEVFLEDDGDAAAILISKGAGPQKDGVILATGEKVDLIGVGEFDERDLPNDFEQRAFILSHHWALVSASPLQLVVIDTTGTRLAEASTPVASTPALVSMKLAAAASRAEGAAAKRASDIFDAYRLLSTFDADQSISSAIREGPADLARLIRSLALRLLVDDALRSVRWMLSLGGSEMQDTTVEDLRGVGQPLVDALDG